MLMGLAEVCMLGKLESLVRKWQDECYPPDIFDGSSGDEGDIKVVEIRKVLDTIEEQREKMKAVTLKLSNL